MVRIVGKYDVKYTDLGKIKAQSSGKLYLTNFLNGNSKNYKYNIEDISIKSKSKILSDYENGKIFILADTLFSPALNYVKEKNSNTGHYVLNSSKNSASIFFNSSLEYLIRTLKPQYGAEISNIVESKIDENNFIKTTKDEIEPEEKCNLDIDKFVEEYKKIHSVYDSRTMKFIKVSLNKSSEKGLRRLLKDIKKFYNPNKKCPTSHVAYMLATIKIESYNYLKGIFFNPISELGGNKYAEEMYDPILGKNQNRRKIAKDIGNTKQGDGEKFKGRGFVQITGKSNYSKFSKKLNINLLDNPEKALDWKTSFDIMTIGMNQGTFTGKKLNDYLTNTKTDYYNARRIINGTNKASVIEQYAKEFEKCLLKSK